MILKTWNCTIAVMQFPIVFKHFWNKFQYKLITIFSNVTKTSSLALLTAK